jgi:hypothetical protein
MYVSLCCCFSIIPLFLSLWLHSGDCCVMERERRYALHGVPRVQQNTCPAILLKALRDTYGPDKGAALASYMCDHRININLRTASCNCNK